MEMRGGVTDARPNIEDRATQPMEAGGWVSQIFNIYQNVGQVMFSHHADQMSQRSQVSRVALWMSSSKVLTQWQGHLLSCSGQLKSKSLADKVKSITCFGPAGGPSPNNCIRYACSTADIFIHFHSHASTCIHFCPPVSTCLSVSYLISSKHLLFENIAH